MIPIYTMDNGTRYVLESDMSDDDRKYFKAFQFLAACPVPDNLQQDDHAHYLHDWQRFDSIRNRIGDRWKEVMRERWPMD